MPYFVFIPQLALHPCLIMVSVPMQRLEEGGTPQKGRECAARCKLLSPVFCSLSLVCAIIALSGFIVSAVEDCFPCTGCRQYVCDIQQTSVNASVGKCYEHVFLNGTPAVEFDKIVTGGKECTSCTVPCFTQSKNNKRRLYRNATWDDRTYFEQCPVEAYGSVGSIVLFFLLGLTSGLASGELTREPTMTEWSEPMC